MDNSSKICENKERYLFLDLMKIIALVLMPCIHIFNLFSAMGFTGKNFPTESVSTQLGFIYLIVPGVFMFCMGAGIVLSKKSTPKELLLRGFKLLLIGFILNVVRGSIYIWFGLLIEKSYLLEFWYWLWGSDILFFAGLYFLLFALFRKLKLGDISIGAISIVFLAISHFIMPVSIQNATLSEFFGNFVYIDEDSCFPLLSWVVFPTSGYLYTKYLVLTKRKNKYVSVVLAVTTFALVAVIGGLSLTDKMQSRYYLWGEKGFMMDIPSAVIAVFVAAIYASIMYLVSGFISKGKITLLIQKISININTIYCIHWVIIMYLGFFLLLFTDYQTNNPIITYSIGVLVFIISTILSFAYKKIKSKKV